MSVITTKSDMGEDSFIDIRRACHAWLMQRDPNYRKTFHRNQERAARVADNRNRNNSNSNHRNK